MNKAWQKYENEVYDECCRIYGEEKVERNVTKVGVSSQVPRQIDVLVHSDEGDIVFDAKYYSKHVNVKTIEAMIGMYGDLGVERFVVVTNKGYSKAALRRAHLGNENVEADVLSLGELKRMQGYGAMPYSGKYAVTLFAPFAWIIDAETSVHPDTPAILYRTGITLTDAVREKEFAYLRFWIKNRDEVNTIEQLAEHHKEECTEADPNGQWSILEEQPYVMASYAHSKSTIVEYFGYKDFDEFMIFIVLYCEEEKWERNRHKLSYMLEHALPMYIRREE